jgi:iron complex transport system ATP-binding protein
MSEVLLSVKDLTVGYSEGATQNILFKNLDLQLKAGELICFMGSNGVGKSTLIKTLAGLHKPVTLPVGWNLDPKKISVV